MERYSRALRPADVSTAVEACSAGEVQHASDLASVVSSVKLIAALGACAIERCGYDAPPFQNVVRKSREVGAHCQPVLV